VRLSLGHNPEGDKADHSCAYPTRTSAATTTRLFIGSGMGGLALREYYRLAGLGALALKSAVWETMITQRPLRLAIR
jgi:hypothetical protein